MFDRLNFQYYLLCMTFLIVTGQTIPLFQLIIASTLSIITTYSLFITDIVRNENENVWFCFLLWSIIINKLHMLELLPLSLFFMVMSLVPEDNNCFRNFLYVTITLINFYQMVY